MKNNPAVWMLQHAEPTLLMSNVHRPSSQHQPAEHPDSVEPHGVGADPQRRSPRLAVVCTLWVVACHIDIAPLFHPRQSVNQIGTKARHYS
jgi:hypothetical protein